MTVQCLKRNWSTVAGLRSNCRVLPNGCWLWLGTCCGSTPKVRAFDPAIGEKRAMSVQRAMWFAAFGRWPAGKAFSGCSTPGCVNPTHLREARDQAALVQYLGRTGRLRGLNTEQRAAAARKGRAAQGTKDTPPDVVRAIRAATGTDTAIARRFGVWRKTVRHIKDGRSYGWVVA